MVDPQRHILAAADDKQQLQPPVSEEDKDKSVDLAVSVSGKSIEEKKGGAGFGYSEQS